MLSGKDGTKKQLLSLFLKLKVRKDGYGNIQPDSL